MEKIIDNKMNISDENNFKNINDNKKNYVNENLKNKFDEKIDYLDKTLGNKFDKKIKEEKSIYDKNTDIRIYENQISKKKKRAFTLGAIDGIGDISILKAPLINPENPKVEPPILQLPSATNLIKNIHLKINFDKNIDKSYKYRTQNSNKDIINNMKPLYSLPEKVMTYYMNTNNEQGEEWNVNRNTKYCVNESNKEKKDEDEKKEEKYEKKKDSENRILIDTLSDKKEIEFSKKENISNKEVNLHRNTISSNNNNNHISRKEKSMQLSKAKLIQKNEENKQFKNNNDFYKDSLENSNFYKDNFNHDKHFNEGNLYKIFNNKSNDELKLLEANHIMSSTLANALKKLADDVFV
ncbi:conserved Plasmodium protein, unknown function [Plasmodium gallinaceum]|uniref:Uncharacterized protein n=1 Tax=Plasmodium gallinaceum TaxID=5849 RepID=A0A1J1GN93_PLAGA|nr:conserved Plasmodium protein, unknown function [Plasmodium gallinaceum]CRG93853.1 conserved Plasmodium protein, unknown function [Plasmodium gallinaceum]